ncbi:MAG TPA: RidA family protein [Kofleriaceae bacterium]|nr:RidA family protein [Kofleriaceae bacterium]
MGNGRAAVATEAAPKAIGPYSQAIRAGGLVFCSGQIALDPASGELVGGGDVAAETRQVLANLAAVLKAAGAGPDRVVKTTIFLVDLGDFAVVNEIYGEMFPAAPPARSTVEVRRLPRDARVEIEAIAVT